MTKRSEYIINKAIGPGVIDQLTYLDRAKAVLHISGVIPVPDRHIDLAPDTAEFVGKGSVLRLLPDTVNYYITFSTTSTFSDEDQNSIGAVFVEPDQQYFIVAAEDYIQRGIFDQADDTAPTTDANPPFRVEITED